MTLVASNAGIQGMLKDYFTRVREDVVPIITPLWAQIQRLRQGGARNFTYAGKQVIFDCVVGDPVGWSFSDAGWLPESEWSGEVQGAVQLKRGYVRQQFDRLMNTITRNNDGAFISLGQKTNEEFTKKLRLMMQEALHGDGRGIKAVISNVVNQTTFDVQSPYGLAGGGQGALWLRPGMRIAIRNAAGATVRAFGTATSARVTSVTLQTAPDVYRVVVDATGSGIVATDIVLAATAFDDAWNGLPNGLINILNRGGSFATLHGISGAANATPGGSPNGDPRWNPRRINAATGGTARPDQLTDPDLTDLCIQVRMQSGVDALANPDEFIIVTTPFLKRSYNESKVGHMRLTNGELRELNGGYGYDCAFNGIPIIDDPYLPVGTVALLHLPSLGWIDGEDWGVVAMDGMDEFRAIPNRDAFEVSRGIYFNIVTTRRNAHGVIEGYAEPVRYSPLPA